MSSKKVKLPVDTEIEEVAKALSELGARWATVARTCTDDTIEIEVIGRKGFVYLPCWIPKELREQIEKVLSLYGGEPGDQKLPY
uniref:Uncharacterized protein n=1 Tax=Fervidicoccus fontis TaxID=683846 RepID=A0A7J3ZLQ7_9CREN